MKIAMVALHDHNIYPAFADLAIKLADAGAEVYYLTRAEIGAKLQGRALLHPVRFERPTGLGARLPWIRTGNDRILRLLRTIRPDCLVAQHEFVVPGLVYKRLFAPKLTFASCFFDNDRDRKYMKLVKVMADQIDVQIDACDRLREMRQQDWPRLNATSLTIRHSPMRRQGAVFEPHEGPARIAFTSSRYILGLNRDRLSRFLARLCDRGISIDWYFAETAETRAIAQSLVSHPLFNVRPPVEKRLLVDTIRNYDAGLHWAPMADQAYDYNYFQSAASNKIGEYIAAGLVVVHAGNPGLCFIPDDVGLVYEATDPEAGADSVAAVLLDRVEVERRRRACLRYHLDEMNFEAQSAPTVDHLLKL